MAKNLKMMILAALFAALTAVGAFIKVPLGFTAITLQVFFTCLSGVLLGAKWGLISQAVYVVLGIVGLPIFTEGGGFSYFLKPSMGFLIGLLPMAFVVGLLTKDFYKKKNGWLWIILGLVAGEVVLYLIGVPYMGIILNAYLEKGLSISQILMSGCVIYLPGDAIKLVAVGIISFPVVKALKKANLL